MNVNIAAAKEFLNALDPTNQYTFQVFDDTEEKRSSVAANFSGTFENVAQQLVALNSQKLGVFVTVNRTDMRGRKTENVVALRALFIDVDGKPIPESMPVDAQPSMMTIRSADRWHAYWLLKEGEPLSEFERAQEHLRIYYNSDPKVFDLPRVMRIPGFIHNKGEPREVVLGPCDPNLRYTIAEVLAAHPIPEQPKPAPYVPVPYTGNGDERAYRNWAREAAKDVVEGNRNNQIFTIACQGVGRHFTENVVLDVCMTHANGLSENEVKTVVRSAFSKDRTATPLPARQQTSAQATKTMTTPEEPAQGQPKEASSWPTVEDAAEGEYMPEPRPDDLIEGMAFMGSKISFSAPSKARKTFLQIHLAICVATGTPFFGKVVKQGKVLYLNLELSRYSFQKRVRDIERTLGVRVPKNMLKVWHLRGHCVNIEELEKQMFETAHHGEYALLVYDPLYKLLGARDENAAGQMADLLNRLERIAHKLGSAYLVAHHFAKGNASNKQAIDRASGSGVVARDGDTIIILTPHKEIDCFAFEAICRDHAPVPQTVLRWTYPIYIEDTTLDPLALYTAPPKPKAPVEPYYDELPKVKWTITSFVQAFITKEPKTKGAICLLAEGHEIKPYRAEEFIKDAEGAGLIFRWKDGPSKQHSFATVEQPALLG